MEYHVYLSLIPEALVVSMLRPDEFGRYLAVGTKKRAREQAVYFELKGDFESNYFDMEKAIKLCTPHDDGQPKHSVYVSIYRVLEHVPLETFGSLWLATRDGLSLELKQDQLPETIEKSHHLYKELCPVHPLIASLLNPMEFCKFITDPSVSISVPTICFVDLRLGNMLDGLDQEVSWNLPYKRIKHLRNCLLELTEKEKTTKTVDRIHSARVPFRCIKTGFFVSNQDMVLYYPFPSAAEMEKTHHKWWRSAQLS